MINVLLLLVSILVYLSYGISGFIFILFSTITSYLVGIYNGKYKKILTVITIIINLLILILNKISIFDNIISILGVSYYTLQIISYLVDVYKKRIKPEKNIFKYTLFIFYIPHLFMGPIYTYQQADDLFSKKEIKAENLLNGIIRICFGLFKKLVIASKISIVTSYIVQNELSGTFAFFAMVIYSIEIYTDFSGGIDIILGVSKIFNISLIENFDSPFSSQSIKEFWNRWHISLGNWLKNYIYIPLGGNKKGNIRKKVNILITFIISGLWHGINFVYWGIMQGIFVMFGESLKTKVKIINQIFTFILISISWAFFIWPNNSDALNMIVSIFTNININELINNFLNIGINIADWIIIIISTFIVFVFDTKKDLIIKKIKSLSCESKMFIIGILIVIIIIFGNYGIGFNVNNFIYSNF